MTVAIRFENVAKQYRLGEVGTGTLSHDLQRWFARVCGRPDPFAKVSQENDRAVAADRASPSYVWALRDISFDIHQGDVVGIIGRNGAGKSTLLKLLSRVTAPTRGEIKARGRIASLLEVGTGFHPELTGRENIYLNGAVLGMRRREIDRRLDEIIEFSGCARYIDTPVKRYSSGMTVRLGFAVAAHLECEILVVDEVLAVGDAEFQKRCIGRMKGICEARGKTILFVSHNMSAVRSLCSRGLYFSQGGLTYDGSIEEAVNRYQAENAVNENRRIEWREPEGQDRGAVTVHLARVSAADKPASHAIDRIDELLIEVLMTVHQPVRRADVGVSLADQYGTLLCGSYKPMPLGEAFQVGRPVRVTCRLPGHVLNVGRYTIGFAVAEPPYDTPFVRVEEAVSFEVTEVSSHGDRHETLPGLIRPDLKWSVEELTAISSSSVAAI